MGNNQTKFKCFLVKFPLLFKLHIRHFGCRKLKEKKNWAEFVMSENVTWSFFLPLKLTLFSQKSYDFSQQWMVSSTKNSPYFVQKCKKQYQSSRFLRKTMEPGGRTEIFLKSHNRAHTCRIEKRFSVDCSSSDALSDKIYFWRKSKNSVFSILVTSASVTS